MSVLPTKQYDHPATNLEEADGSQQGQQVADVVPLAGEKSMGSGQDSRAVDYALGKKSSPNVISIGTSTLGSWARRQSGK